MIQNCFGPLGGLLAMLGAFGFMGVFFGATIGIGQYIMDTERYKAKNEMPGMLILAFAGAGLIVIVLVLAFINQSLLPPSCGGPRLW